MCIDIAKGDILFIEALHIHILFVCYLQLNVNVLESIKCKIIDVDIDQVNHEDTSIAFFPLMANSVDITWMNFKFPILESLCNLQFRQLPDCKWALFVIINVQNAKNLIFSLIIVDNFSIQIDDIKSSQNQTFHVLLSPDGQSVQSFLIIKDIFDDLKFLP